MLEKYCWLMEDQVKIHMWQIFEKYKLNPEHVSWCVLCRQIWGTFKFYPINANFVFWFWGKKIGRAPLGCQIGNSKTDLFNTSSPNSESTKISMSKFVQTLTQRKFPGRSHWSKALSSPHPALPCCSWGAPLKTFLLHITVTYFVTYLCITLL